MAQTSLSGINSNIDTADIISKMVELEGRPIDLVAAKRTIEDQKLTAFQELKNRLQTFKSVVNTLNTESRFISTQGEFSNNSASDLNTVLNITTTTQATSGTYSLTVQNLATESKLISEGFATTTSAVQEGVFTISTASGTISFNIDSSNNTLDGLRLAINNSGAPVKATFLNDGSATTPVRLLISGTRTGVDNTITLSHKNTLIGGGQTELTSFTVTQAAKNANLIVDGVAITKASNTVTDVLNGAILSLQSAGSGTITLSSDIQEITDKVSAFVDGYNDLNLFLKEQLALDTRNNQTGVLFGNFAVQNLQQSLRNSISSEVKDISGTFTFLSQVGITTQSDGTLLLDKSTLGEALSSDLQNVSQLFSSRGTTSNTSVTFVGFTNDTVPGTYDVRVSGGVPQLSKSGENNYVDAVGTGNFFAGAPGTDAEGLNFRIGSFASANFGSITLSTGVAETINRQLNNMVDTSLKGPLKTEIDSVTKSIEDFDETISDLEGRLVLFEQNLKDRFTNMEIVLGRLNSQRDAFTNALPGIQSLFSKK